ncbi:transposase [Nocardiopsis sp. NPDC050513]|uniref:transposase n=1 Tax=Nocardiopsis sp. NPDC050513 TaxID=3364338 RepID=UPI0037AE4482
MMLMTLVETGTLGLLGACFGPATAGETAYATRLLPLLDQRHLVLIDRGFDANAFLADLAATGAQFLIRLKSTRRPALLRVLADGTHLARLGRLTARIIEADLTVRLADGTTVSGRYRLATTLLDPASDPAERLTRLYAERWEVESAYFALRSTLMAGRVLRSGDRFGIEQELWATLTVYQLLRMAMTDAARAAGADPDHVSFTHALTAARTQVTLAEGVTATAPGAIDAAVRANLLPARRPRISARKVKSPISRYHSWHGQARPTMPTAVERIEITLHERANITPGPTAGTVNQPSAQESRGDDAASPGTEEDACDPGGRYQLALAIMSSAPDTPWHAREIARMVDVTNINGFRVQMSQWSHLGLIKKTGPAIYTLAS